MVLEIYVAAFLNQDLFSVLFFFTFFIFINKAMKSFFYLFIFDKQKVYVHKVHHVML